VIGRRNCDKWGRKESTFGKKWSNQKFLGKNVVIPKSTGSSDSNGAVNESSSQDKAGVFNCLSTSLALTILFTFSDLLCLDAFFFYLFLIVMVTVRL